MNTLKTTILLAVLTGLMLVIGRAIGGQSGMIIALFLAVIMNFSAYWFSDKLVLSIYRAQPVTPAEAPELYQIVEELARRASIPMPKVYIVENDTPNAFATGRSPEHAAVAATTGILRILNRDELMGVLAHELGHVQHRDTLTSAIAATLAGAIGMLASMAQWAMLFGFGRQDEREEGGAGVLASIVIMVLAPIAATLIQLAISRSREYAADAKGAELCGNPLWLANALRKLETANRQMPLSTANDNPATAHLFIVNPLHGGGVMNWFATHPPIDERVRRLEAMAGSVIQR